MGNSSIRRHPRLRRQTRPVRRLSGLAIYLIFLNIVSIGMLLFAWSGMRRVASGTLPLPNAVVAQQNTGVLVPVIEGNGSGSSLQQVVAAPTVTPTGPLQAGNVPILMYHYIRTVDQASDPLGFNLSVTPSDFDTQLQWLRDNGYSTVSMATAQRCIQGEPLCPPKAVVLTFDDGYLDAFTDALPALQRYGFSGTFYIVNDFVGQPAYMNWDQIVAMHTAGMEIGSHTLSHLDLTQIDPTEARRQITQSKLDLEARLGFQITSFCYPSGRYNGDTEAMVRDAGYANATTTRSDTDYSDIIALPRVRIEGGKGLDVFASLLGGV